MHLRHREVVQAARAPQRCASACRPSTSAMRAMARVFADRRLYEAAQRAGRLAQWPLVRDGKIRRLPGPLAGWTSTRDLPPCRAQSFRDWWRAAVIERVPGRRRARERRPRGDPRPHPRARCATSPTAERPEDVAGRPRLPARRRAAAAEQLVDRLAERVRDYHAEVRLVAAGRAGRRRRRRRAPRWACAAWSVPAGVPDGVAPARRRADRGRRPSSAAELDAIDGAVTGCAAAIAETGTLVLDGQPICGRRVITLVPDHHICVVSADQIVEHVPEAIARLAPAVRDGRRAGHVGLRAVGELGHRALAGRGRPRPAPPRWC